MTEGPLIQHDKPMCVRIWLEVGHTCEPRRSALGQALALDWRVWVRDPSGHDISAFVHKVVFHLHPPSAFVYPKRVLQEPPYEIQESGCASIDIPIHVYLKYSNKPKKIRLRYSLQIENNGENKSESSCVYYDFPNPSEQLRQSLMEGGGQIIGGTGFLKNSESKLVVVQNVRYYEKSQKNNKIMKAKRYKFIEPIHCKHKLKKGTKDTLDEICSKCGDSTNADLKKLLRTVSMTDDEINQVSQLYSAHSQYEKSIDPLTLPPFSDPIYHLPELPLSLRGVLTSVEASYAMQ